MAVDVHRQPDACCIVGVIIGTKKENQKIEHIVFLLTKVLHLYVLYQLSFFSLRRYLSYVERFRLNLAFANLINAI